MNPDANASRAVPLSQRTLVRELERTLTGCKRILELGCGESSPLLYLAQRFHIEGLDVFEPWLNRCVEKGLLKRGHLGDVREIDSLFEENSFDAVVALDLIEHLEKEEGLKLIEDMKRISSNKVIIFTPNGFVHQSGDDNPWMEHKSGWTVDEFEQHGFKVTGTYGWKALRGEYAALKYRPRFFWGALSEATQLLYSHNHPRSAFSLFAAYGSDSK